MVWGKPSGTTRDVIIKGKISWHNLVNPDEEQKWKCTIYPDAESMALINELKDEGLLNGLRKDEEGYNMTFTRYRQKVIKGAIKLFDAPIILDKDGVPCEGMGIGHGSDISMKLQVYKYRKPNQSGDAKGTAARMEGIRIYNLIPFNKDKELSTSTARQAKGLIDDVVPKQSIKIWE